MERAGGDARARDCAARGARRGGRSGMTNAAARVSGADDRARSLSQLRQGAGGGMRGPRFRADAGRGIRCSA